MREAVNSHKFEWPAARQRDRRALREAARERRRIEAAEAAYFRSVLAQVERFAESLEKRMQPRKQGKPRRWQWQASETFATSQKAKPNGPR